MEVPRATLGSLSKLLFLSYMWTDSCCHGGLEDNVWLSEYIAVRDLRVDGFMVPWRSQGHRLTL